MVPILALCPSYRHIVLFSTAAVRNAFPKYPSNPTSTYTHNKHRTQMETMEDRTVHALDQRSHPIGSPSHLCSLSGQPPAPPGDMSGPGHQGTPQVHSQDQQAKESRSQKHHRVRGEGGREGGYLYYACVLYCVI